MGASHEYWIAVLLPALFLAFVSPPRASTPVSLPRTHIVVQQANGRSDASSRHLIFDARRSTTFLRDLQLFLNQVPEFAAEANGTANPYSGLLTSFDDAASKEGVAASESGNPVDLAFDWIDQGQWKYFVRLEVDFATFDALFAGANQDPLYRDLTAACMVYGGQGILDFKKTVPDSIDHVHQNQQFKSSKFETRNKKQVEWAYQLAARDVEIQRSRYRTALAYLRARGIDAEMLEKKGVGELRPELRTLLLHFAELLRLDDQRVENSDFQRSVAILLSDVRRVSPEVVLAILRVGEKNKLVAFDSARGEYDAEPATFRFLLDGLAQH